MTTRRLLGVVGGSLEQWFDVIVHRQTVSPAHAL